MATQVHRTTGDGYSVAVWRVEDHYVVQATENSFLPSRLLRPSEERSSYAEAMSLREAWVVEYRQAAARARIDAYLRRSTAVGAGSF